VCLFSWIRVSLVFSLSPRKREFILEGANYVYIFIYIYLFPYRLSIFRVELLRWWGGGYLGREGLLFQEDVPGRKGYPGQGMYDMYLPNFLFFFLFFFFLFFFCLPTWFLRGWLGCCITRYLSFLLLCFCWQPAGLPEEGGRRGAGGGGSSEGLKRSLEVPCELQFCFLHVLKLVNRWSTN